MNTGRLVSLSQNSTVGIWKKSGKQANKVLCSVGALWSRFVLTELQRCTEEDQELFRTPCLPCTGWDHMELGFSPWSHITEISRSLWLPAKPPAVFTTLENSVLGKPRAPGTGSSEQDWNVDKSHWSTGRDIPRDTVNLQEENTLCNVTTNSWQQEPNHTPEH